MGVGDCYSLLKVVCRCQPRDGAGQPEEANGGQVAAHGANGGANRGRRGNARGNDAMEDKERS